MMSYDHHLLEGDCQSILIGNLSFDATFVDRSVSGIGGPSDRYEIRLSLSLPSAYL